MPRAARSSADGGGGLLGPGRHEGEPRVRDGDLGSDGPDRLDHHGFRDHVLRIELHSVDRFGVGFEEVAVQRTRDVALVLGEVGEGVELRQRLGNAEGLPAEEVVEPGGVGRLAADGEVAVDEQHLRCARVASVDQELGHPAVGDQVAGRGRDGDEGLGRVDLFDGERSGGRADSGAGLVRGANGGRPREETEHGCGAFRCIRSRAQPSCGCTPGTSVVTTEIST